MRIFHQTRIMHLKPFLCNRLIENHSFSFYFTTFRFGFTILINSFDLAIAFLLLVRALKVTFRTVNLGQFKRTRLFFLS
jgi:hypothetical protein